jgi:cytochrome c2
MNKGCWGCHRFEGFDKEADELSLVRQRTNVLRDEQGANEKESRRQRQLGDVAPDNEAAQKHYGRAEALRIRNSRLDPEVDSLVLEEKNLAQEVRKFGPNLKELKVKLRKEWVPVWLKNPHEFRPGAKMPVFRLADNEIQAISAYIWQNATVGTVPARPAGNAERGKELFETRGCLGCHSMGEGDAKIGGTFAANLTRVGEKTNYNFLVRWIHDPAEVTPSADGSTDALAIPLMPSLRLSFDDTQDIASYLITQKTDATYAEAPFMDDPALAAEGLTLVRHYGCSGCHEIAGMENEGRIGTELTLEGSKPIERLDFALLGHDAKHEGWYDHKGFFERKLENPAIFDQGKVKPHLEQLRMPNFDLQPEEVQALTTFLLGAVDTSFPSQYRYEPEDARRDVQEGWWIARRYNCMGCHQILPGDATSFMTMPRYQDPDWKEQMPPQLFTEGARVQPDWLISFLTNPAMSETDIHRNGVRQYLQARMPTFHFTERQVSKLMRFFMAKATQPLPYLPETLAPLTQNELTMARNLFNSRGAPCLKCHATGEPAHDRTATAPNFLLASERLKSDWTYRWLLDPAKISPGTAMPSELFRLEGDRWVFSGPLPASFAGYEGDHAKLLVRYMFQFTPDELRRLRASGVQ